MPNSSDSELPAVFRNNTPIFAWVFMAGCMAMLVYFTSFATNLANTPGIIIGILAICWVVGLAFTALVLWVPIVRVDVTADGVTVLERAILWRRRRQFAASELSMSDITEEVGSEGGHHYHCSVVLPDGESILIAQSGTRSKVAAVRLQLISALLTSQRLNSKNAQS